MEGDKASAAPPVVALAGFMGAGKTSVARALSRLLACRAVDLDELVTERQRRAPHAIIEEDGEAAFRAVETRVLRETLVERHALVIALGGGAYTIAENRALLDARAAFVVWLDAPFELCWERINGGAREGDDARGLSDQARRPLARGLEQTRALYDARRAHYALAALRVEVRGEESADALAAKIAGAFAESK